MALTLNSMLTKVKTNIPITTIDDELQDALIERMNYLVSLDTFPFQEKYQSATLSAGSYLLSTPPNFATPKDVVIWESNGMQLEIMDAVAFSFLFPNPSDETSGTPIKCCIKVAEGELWFNCPADIDYTIRLYYYAIPDDLSDPTIIQLTELAKLTLVKWATADGFRILREFDTAQQWEAEGNRFLQAMQRRYKLSLQEGARFISPQEAHVFRKKRLTIAGMYSGALLEE